MSSNVDGILTVNTGSSSLKAGLYQAGTKPRPLLAATAERLGQQGGRLELRDADGKPLRAQDVPSADHAAALALLLGWITELRPNVRLVAAGHRIVRGTEHLLEPQLLTPALLQTLDALLPLDPDHLPQALAAVRALSRAHPDLQQVACFDSSFHRSMPPVARAYPLPAAVRDAGVVRLGYHGLSYEYIVGALQAQDAAGGRLLIAHLGSGASLAAVRDGCSIDTTMGFSPTGGLMMSTRTGDLDPGVLLYLLQEQKLSAAELSDLLNKRSGLLGVSGSSGDMRDLLAREADDPDAAAAVALFCYTALKQAGALIAALGGLDTLVFTGGIGEHAAPVRARICAGLAFLGLRLDADRNAAHAPLISTGDSAVSVRVLPANEDLIIARHTAALLGLH